MKYETMVKIHRLFYEWSLSLGSFEPKDEYTIFDLLLYLPLASFGFIMEKIDSVYTKRRKWIIAKKR